MIRTTLLASTFLLAAVSAFAQGDPYAWTKLYPPKSDASFYGLYVCPTPDAATKFWHAGADNDGQMAHLASVNGCQWNSETPGYKIRGRYRDLLLIGRQGLPKPLGWVNEIYFGK